MTKKRRNAGLGTYPETSVAEAANKARHMREQLSKGTDPLDAKATAALGPSIPSVRRAAEQLHAELTPGWKNVKHAQQWINTLSEYAFPIIGPITLEAVLPRHVADVLRPIWLSKPETASRVKQRLHAVFAWGWAHGHCQANPVDVVDHLLPAQPSKTIRTQHQPAMPWREVPTYVERCAPAPHSDTTLLALEFLILTAARSGEVRFMDWSEVDIVKRCWTIPASRMKAKQAHRVPLSERAMQILEMAGTHKGLVFPSPRSGTPLSDMTLTAHLRRTNAPCDVAGRHATAHGFRSSFRDWCSEKGYARDLAERSLAHAVANKVEAAYHRTDLLEQRRPMMESWSEFVRPR